MTHLAYIMHKDVSCLSFYMNDDGKCVELGRVLNKEHIPPGVNSILGVNRFLKHRQLNPAREDVKKIKALNLCSEETMLPFHFLSPFDCYWVRYDFEMVPFNALTLYQPKDEIDIFTVEEGTLLEDLSRDTANLSFDSKNQAFYISEDDGRFLQEAFIKNNSVWLQKIYAKYLSVLKGNYCIYRDKLFYEVPNITSRNMEYISFEDYFLDFWESPENAGYTDEEAFFECLRQQNFPNWEKTVSTLLSLDEKYGVERSMRSFGILRDPDSLSIISMAPIFSYDVA